MRHKAMHNSSWSKIRKILEEDRLCPFLRGRIQYFMTRYRHAHDEYGRFCVRVDDKVYVCSCFGDLCYDKQAEQQKLGIFPVWKVGKAINAYMDDLSVDEALASDDLLVRMLAVLDRRVGKRRLPQLAAAMASEPEWLQFFYRLRLEAEGFNFKEESSYV